MKENVLLGNSLSDSIFEFFFLKSLIKDVNSHHKNDMKYDSLELC